MKKPDKKTIIIVSLFTATIFSAFVIADFSKKGTKIENIKTSLFERATLTGF